MAHGIRNLTRGPALPADMERDRVRLQAQRYAEWWHQHHPYGSGPALLALYCIDGKTDLTTRDWYREAFEALGRSVEFYYVDEDGERV